MFETIRGRRRSWFAAQMLATARIGLWLSIVGCGGDGAPPDADIVAFRPVVPAGEASPQRPVERAITEGAAAARACRADAPMQVGLTKLRRLTRAELNHTVRDMLGVQGTPADAISPDERIGPFDSNATAPITELLVQQHSEMAAALATQAVGLMDQIAPCDLAADGADGCASRFVETSGLKAFRRPLDATEKAAYVALYNLGREQGVQNGFRLVLDAMLQAPSFLYHADVGVAGAPTVEPTPLTQFELASRLSYFLWDTLPDNKLFALAEEGQLSDGPVLEQQVRRMLDDQRSFEAVPNFYLQWLGIRDMEGVEKDAEQFPGFDAAMVQAMINETASFTDYVIRHGDGLMNTLFTASFSIVDDPLLPLYGVERPSGLASSDPIQLDPAQRSGILTQGAFLAAHAHHDQTSPVHRGLFVRENILCQTIPPPPPDVIPTPPPPTPGTTMRERIAVHQSEPSCAGCHQMMDQIGLGFESYDATGAYRSEEDNRPVDDTGSLLSTGDEMLDGPFDGARALSERLSQSSVVQQCLTSQWFRFALGRSASKNDECSLEHMQERFVESGGNIRELIVSIALSDAFRNVRSSGDTAE